MLHFSFQTDCDNIKSDILVPVNRKDIVLGVVLPIPFGIILGPLLGAIIGDLVGGNHIRQATKSGFGSFVGFLLATGMKVIFSCVIGILIFVKIGGLVYDAIVGMF